MIDRVDGWMAASRPGALVYHPYISDAGERGPFINPAAKASLIGLNQSHRFAELVRAVIEGLGMAARDCYASIGDIPRTVRLSGGAARSPALRKVLSAALGASTQVSGREEAGAAGAAMIAAGILRAGPGMRLTHGYPTPLRLKRREAERQPMVRALRDGLVRVEMAGADPVEMRVVARDGTRVDLEIDGARCRAVLLARQGGVTLQMEGRCHDFDDLTFAPAVIAAAAAGDGKVRASTNGNVVSVDVAVGDLIEAGQKLVVVEAMKMEHSHASGVAGKVTAVNVTCGMQISTHDVLVEIEAQ